MIGTLSCFVSRGNRIKQVSLDKTTPFYDVELVFILVVFTILFVLIGFSNNPLFFHVFIEKVVDFLF
jgi:hypothetical protein